MFTVFMRNTTLDIIFAIVCVVIITYYCAKQKKYGQGEMFVQDNNENIAYISNSLTLYYSVFSDSSYNHAQGNQGDLKKWYNISSYFKQSEISSCSSMRFNESHMNFFNNPTYSREDGIMLGNNYITGPMSYTLGISGNTQYSIFIFIKFMSISQSNNDIEIFKIFGNNNNLNGIRLYMTGNNTDSVATDISGCNMYLEIGANQPIQCIKDGSRNAMFQHNKSYLFIMTNNNSSIRLSLYDSLKNSKMDLINAPVSSKMYDVSFSNQNMIINQYQNLNGNIYAFGVYNKVLSDNDMLNLQTHLFSQIQVMDPVIVEKEKIIETLKSDINSIKACPYNQETCAQCASVTDWTNINAVLTTNDLQCLDAINKFCTENPSHYMCKCWNSNDNSYTSTQCGNYRNIYTNKTCIDINDVNKADLSKLKSKYALCNCQEETINIQPLQMPDISKFKIPNKTIDALGNACPENNTETNLDPMLNSQPLQQTEQNTTQQSAKATFSGYKGDMTTGIVNFFETAKNPYLNASSLVSKNAKNAGNKVNKIPDHFADLDINYPIKQKDTKVKNFWQE